MNLIVAVTKNWGIGKDGKMLVHLPADLKYYKEKTIGNVVVMGLKTYYSLPVRPLPNRITIVLTRNKDFKDDRVLIANSLPDLFKLIEQFQNKEIFICGGSNVYNQLINYCEKAYVTKINTVKKADTFFPNIDDMNNWELIGATEPKTDNNLEYSFLEYKNNKINKVDI